MAVSTSAKPCSSNQARTALAIAPRAIRKGFRSACRAGDHHGEGWSIPIISNPWLAGTEHSPASLKRHSRNRQIPLKSFDFLCDAALRRQHPALNPFCHGETRSPCPFHSTAEARVLDLVAGSTVQWPEFATGYEHVWRPVGKNCNPFVRRPRHGGASHGPVDAGLFVRVARLQQRAARVQVPRTVNDAR